ncbi:MAG: hypothetical protein ACOY82_11330 [Pseudomonadota bacterium]
MHESESLLLRHGWWVGMLVANLLYGGLLFGMPLAAAIPGAVFLVLTNAYSIFTIRTNRAGAVRVRNVSSESQACMNWLWTAGLLVGLAPELFLSSQRPGGKYLLLAVLLLSVHYGQIRLALGWEGTDPAPDERDRKIAKDSADLMYAALTLIVVATPLVLPLGADVRDPLERSRGWFVCYFIACFLVSLLVGQTYALAVYAIEIFRSRAAREDR